MLSNVVYTIVIASLGNSGSVFSAGVFSLAGKVTISLPNVLNCVNPDKGEKEEVRRQNKNAILMQVGVLEG
jgi:hypothetical protein